MYTYGLVRHSENTYSHVFKIIVSKNNKEMNCYFSIEWKKLINNINTMHKGTSGNGNLHLFITQRLLSFSLL